MGVSSVFVSRMGGWAVSSVFVSRLEVGNTVLSAKPQSITPYFNLDSISELLINLILKIVIKLENIPN